MPTNRILISLIWNLFKISHEHLCRFYVGVPWGRGCLQAFLITLLLEFVLINKEGWEKLGTDRSLF